MRKIKVELSRSGIQKAIQEVRKYKTDFMKKQQILVDRLSQIGLDVVRETMENIPSEEKGSYHTEIVRNNHGDIVGAAIRLSGDKILFLEFSAGIRYGTDSYPTPAGDKYGMGTYPGKGHWNSPYGWWYVDEDGEKHHSYGNRAYMPMYHAEEAVILAIRSIAREVFS